MPNNDILQSLYNDLRKRISAVESKVKVVEKSTFTGGLQAFTFANLPTTGLGDNVSYTTVAFCSDGRKSGEGAGLGTGVIVFWDVAANAWLRVEDNAAVTI